MKLQAALESASLIFNWHIACQAGAAVKLRDKVAIIATYNRLSQTLQVPQKINFFFVIVPAKLFLLV